MVWLPYIQAMDQSEFTNLSLTRIAGLRSLELAMAVYPGR